MSKQYGLILPNKKGETSKAPPIFTANRNVFGDDSDSDENVKISKIAVSAGEKSKRQAKVVQNKVLEEDPTVYQYDELYDDISTEKNKKKQSTDKSKVVEKKSRYIEKLLHTAERRKKENERRVERQIQKEREEEGDKFADKEAFVTSAYKKKLEEMKLEDEREQREKYLEDIGDVTKQADLDGFYRHLYEQQLRPEKQRPDMHKLYEVKKEPTDDDEEAKPAENKESDNEAKPTKNKESDNEAKPTKNKESGNEAKPTKNKESDNEAKPTKNKESDNEAKPTKNKDSDENKKATDKNKVTKDKRSYRKRKSSGDDEGLNKDDDSDVEVNRKAIRDKKSGKKQKLDEVNPDADSDFSVDESSSEDESESSEEKDTNKDIDSNKKPKKDTESNPKKTSDEKDDVEFKKPLDVAVKEELKEDKIPVEEIKPKIDIWKKRTVGEVFDQAVQRYYQRKAARSC